MRLSRTIAYAVHATLELAHTPPGMPVPCSQIARSGKMPERFLLQILRKLVNRGILQSTRGVVGGYYLSRPPEEISLREIVESFENPLEPSASALEALSPVPRAKILVALTSASAAACRELDKLSVADLRRGGSMPILPAIPSVNVAATLESPPIAVDA
jgi:Rrf2 family protein